MLFLDEVMRGVEGSLSEIGWSLLISVLPRGGDVADAAERLQKISAKVDGLIIAEGIVVSSGQLRLLAGRVPIALVAGRPGEAHADVIHADNRRRDHRARPPPGRAAPPDQAVLRVRPAGGPGRTGTA